MYNAMNDYINDSVLSVNLKMSDLNSVINSDKIITNSDCYKKLALNHAELNALFTHSVEYTESDQFHDRYWDRVEESDAVREYAESTERSIRHKWHSLDFTKHYGDCLKLLNQDQSEKLEMIHDERNEEMCDYYDDGW